MKDPLEPLLADGVIDEVLGRLKSGKEANIYLVSRAGQTMAAKVYKDRNQRNFKNNADYKEGRKTRNSRTQRAIESGGRFGREAAEQAWKSTESDALRRLHDRGVRVPKPEMFYEGVLLMQLVTDGEGRPAPRLIDVEPDAPTASALYLDLRGQIIRMLCCEIIHGDLSPYNILAAVGGPTIIDFPQIVSPAHSSRAEFFFQRDFENVLAYVVGAEPALAQHAHEGREIWRAYTRRELMPDFIPPKAPPPKPPRPPQERRSYGQGQGAGQGQGQGSYGPGRGQPQPGGRPQPGGYQVQGRSTPMAGPGPARSSSGPGPGRGPDRSPGQGRGPERTDRTERPPGQGRPQQPFQGRPQQPFQGRPQPPPGGGRATHPGPAHRTMDRGPAPHPSPDRGADRGRSPDERAPRPPRPEPQRSFGPDAPRGGGGGGGGGGGAGGAGAGGAGAGRRRPKRRW